MSRRHRSSIPMSLFSFQDIITATTGILVLLALVLALSVIIQGAESTVEIEFADDAMLAYRDDLAAEVVRMKTISKELSDESATWSSSTPSELKTKIESAASKQNRLLQEVLQYETALNNQKKKFQLLDSVSKADDIDGKLKNENLSIADLAKKLKELKAQNRVVYNFRNNSRIAWLVEVSDSRILAAKVGSKETPKSFRSAYEFNKFALGLPSSERYFVLILKPSGIGNYDIIKPFLGQEDADVGTELIAEDQVSVDPVTGASF